MNPTSTPAAPPDDVPISNVKQFGGMLLLDHAILTVLLNLAVRHDRRLIDVVKVQVDNTIADTALPLHFGLEARRQMIALLARYEGLDAAARPPIKADVKKPWWDFW